MSGGAGAEQQVSTKKKQIVKKHVENTSKIYPPTQSRRYWMTKTDPKNRNHSHPIYGRTLEELEDKIVAHYLGISEEENLTVGEILRRAVDEDTPTGARSLQRFRKRLSCLESVRIADLDEKLVREALEALRSQGVTKKEFNNSVSCLNKVHDYCAYHHIGSCDIRSIVSIWRKVRLTGKHVFVDNSKEARQLAFTRAEASRIVSHALRCPSYKALAVAVLITTGLRGGELLALSDEDVRLREGYIWVHRMEDKSYRILDYTKQRNREVYLSQEAEAVVRKALSFRREDPSGIPFLFLNDCSSDGKMHLRAIDAYLRGYVHEKILGYGPETEARSPHDCRRTYASLEYISGTDVYVIKEQLGHSSVKQTEAYVQDVAEAFERRGKLRGCGLLSSEQQRNYTQLCVGKAKKKEA